MEQDQLASPSGDQTNGSTTRRRFTQLAGMGFIGAVAAGCGSAASSPSGAAAASTSGPKGSVDPRTQKYYLVSGNTSDPYYDEVRAGFAAADKAFGFPGTEVTGPENTDIAQIVNLIQELIAKPGTSGLMLPNLDPKAYVTIFKSAQQKQLPIVNYLNDFVGPRIAFIGGDESSEAQTGAQIIGQATGGKGKVAFVAQLIQPDLVNKGKVFAQTIKQTFPGITYLGPYNYDGSPDGGVQTFNAIHSKNPDLAGLYWGDGSGGAVAESIHSSASNVKLILTDVVSASLDAVKAGHAYAAFGPPVFDTSFYAPQLLYWWNSGYRVPSEVLIPSVTVTSANISSFLAAPHTHAQITNAGLQYQPTPALA